VLAYITGLFQANSNTYIKYNITMMVITIIIIIFIIIIQFFIYLLTELNSQWPITESVRIETTAAIRQHKTNKKKYKSKNYYYYYYYYYY
jgi:hypothetical protein